MGCGITFVAMERKVAPIQAPFVEEFTPSAASVRK